jgi:hypothetical protein
MGLLNLPLDTQYRTGLLASHKPHEHTQPGRMWHQDIRLVKTNLNSIKNREKQGKIEAHCISEPLNLMC